MSGTGAVRWGCDSFRGHGLAKPEGYANCMEKALLKQAGEAAELRS